jgi:glycosyltransferase involved in cell wall biosynthesis
MLLDILLSDKNVRRIYFWESEESSTPIVTFLIPIHNQGAVIERHLQAVFENATLPFELLLIDDSSNDDSVKKMKKFLMATTNLLATSGNCQLISLYSTHWPWFETRCDDFGIRNSKADYIIEIQSDMLIKERAFDAILVGILKENPDLAGVSARGTHKLEDVLGAVRNHKNGEINDSLLTRRFLMKVIFKLRRHRLIPRSRKGDLENENMENEQPYNCHEALLPINQVFPEPAHFKRSGSAGWLGLLIGLLPYDGFNEVNTRVSAKVGRLWFGETINRGPLALRKRTYVQLGGFNTRAFFQGNDDHDFFLRATQRNLKVAFTPINFASPIELGSMRRKKPLGGRLWSKINRMIRQKEFELSALYQKASAFTTVDILGENEN